MKQKLLLILFLTFGIVHAQEVTHVDFDTNNANIVFNSWNGSSTFSKVANPASDDANNSEFVGQFTAGNDNGIGIGVINPTTVFTSPFNLIIKFNDLIHFLSLEKLYQYLGKILHF